MKYTGGCHCGQVRYEVDMQIDQIMDCNCSICIKRGHLLAFASENRFNLLKGHHSISDYQWNKKVIHFYFCSNCGVASYGTGKDPAGNEMVAVNVRCFDDVNLDDYPVIKFDGKNLAN